MTAMMNTLGGSHDINVGSIVSTVEGLECNGFHEYCQRLS